jgi:Phosphoketolase
MARESSGTSESFKLLDAYWRAANYLSVGQIYLRANPLLREPLAIEHVKPRLLGHWGTTPGLNFIYAHMNRLIVERTWMRSSSRVRVTAARVSSPTHTSKERTAKFIRPSRATPRVSRGCSRSSHIRAAFRATSRLKHPGRFMKAASLDIRCCTHTARRSTILICSYAA